MYVLSRNVKNIRVFSLNIFQFLEVKFSIYLNRQVFVMASKYIYAIRSGMYFELLTQYQNLREYCLIHLLIINVLTLTVG